MGCHGCRNATPAARRRQEAVAAVRVIDKGIELAQAEGNLKLHHALADSREPLARSSPPRA